ncbi:MAG: methyltransferase domain-containing protein [Candidatus Hydrothermae bacterium]|nr:methyltransferase domain-containing protein [Candidatus Hydrothermae bacterium]
MNRGSIGIHYWGSESYIRSRRERARVIYGVTYHRLRHIQGVWVDVGAGPGILKSELERLFRHPILGLERERALVHVSQRMLLGDAMALPFADCSVDVIFFNHVLEHVPDPEAALHELTRVLKPGGWLYLASPNAWWFWEVHYRLPGIHWMPAGVRDVLVQRLRGEARFDVQLWAYPRLRRTLERMGYRVENVVPLLFYARPAYLRKRTWRWAAAVLRRLPGLRSLMAGPFAPNIMVLAQKQIP